VSANDPHRHRPTRPRRRGYQTYDRAGIPEPGVCAALDFAVDQRPDLQLHVQHDEGWPIGVVEHLERSQTLGLMLVTRCRDAAADLLADGVWYLSPRYRALRTSPVSETYAKLVEASIVRKPAGIGLGPVRWSRHDLAEGAGGAPAGLLLDGMTRGAEPPSPSRSPPTSHGGDTAHRRRRYARGDRSTCSDYGDTVHARSGDGYGRTFRHTVGGAVTSYSDPSVER
jgi:hypothetical protein